MGIYFYFYLMINTLQLYGWNYYKDSYEHGMFFTIAWDYLGSYWINSLHYGTITKPKNVKPKNLYIFCRVIFVVF